jgi:hypothetical protein
VATGISNPRPSHPEVSQEQAIGESTTDKTAAPADEAVQPVGEKADNWTTLLADRIVATLHIDSTTAGILVATAQAHGRDAAYLEDLLTYVQDNPRVDRPAATFQRLVETNAVRRRTTQPPDPQEGQD